MAEEGEEGWGSQARVGRPGSGLIAAALKQGSDEL